MGHLTEMTYSHVFTDLKNFKCAFLEHEAHFQNSKKKKIIKVSVGNKKLVQDFFLKDKPD